MTHLADEADVVQPETLLLAVIAQAVEDRRWLKERGITWQLRDQCQVGMLELNCFFKSTDFDVMCQTVGLSADWIRQNV